MHNDSYSINNFFGMKIVLRLQYDGTNYHGWQSQPNATTIQEMLEKMLSRIHGQKIDVVGCGRTDTGVHAKDYYCNYDVTSCNSDIFQPENSATYINKLNSMLPADICVIQCLKPVNNSFNARFDAVSRTYSYILATKKNPFEDRYSYYYHYPFDIKKMNAACEMLQQYNDFTSFSKSGTQVKTNNCTVKFAQWVDYGDKLTFTITADRFLRNMVRAIVGTMMDIGRGKLSLDDFAKIIEAKDRQCAGESVPAKGLTLINVSYNENTFENFFT